MRAMAASFLNFIEFQLNWTFSLVDNKIISSPSLTGLILIDPPGFDA